MLDRETDDEIIHEFDSALAMDRELLTTANIQLVAPGSLFVRTYSLSFFHVYDTLCFGPVSQNIAVSTVNMATTQQPY